MSSPKTDQAEPALSGRLAANAYEALTIHANMAVCKGKVKPFPMLDTIYAVTTSPEGNVTVGDLEFHNHVQKERGK
jgi:hypothetical protein